ncbi:hypothetical protein F511_16869 [Dorcoceras hygrometricum]|uniref:Uncharacterized protein n=1 Tax=Dorcoceras hygrometricum TaxID=472368 RepID=A0A2Z7BJA3_9LAMI|nr:hypothetical protein F511_16869 [Dorcoceras hygrometricum]
MTLIESTPDAGTGALIRQDQLLMPDPEPLQEAEEWSQGCLWQERVRYPFDENKTDWLVVLREGGRVGAIGNSVNQGLLRPVHDCLMDVLKGIPQDVSSDEAS